MKKEIKTEEERIKGERARKVHASFFDKTEEAIERGYYLEAMCMEFSAIEARMTVIMRELGLQCGEKKTSPQHPDIPLKKKFQCLRYYLKDEVFKDTYFDSAEEIGRIMDWIDDRNGRIHRLYADIEKYEDMTSKNKILAKQGLLYARTMYDEANRLKNMNKRHPEKMKSFKGKCIKNNVNCKKLEDYLRDLRSY